MSDQFEEVLRQAEQRMIIAELERRDEANGIRYPPVPTKSCCFEECPECAPKESAGIDPEDMALFNRLRSKIGRGK